MSDSAVQPLLKDGKQADYGSKDKSDLYYMGVLKEEIYDTSEKTGLTTDQVQERLKKFGRNELADKEDNKWCVASSLSSQPSHHRPPPARAHPPRSAPLPCAPPYLSSAGSRA
jgi:hypothetical protein